MEIIVRLDVVLAQRKMKGKDLAEAIGITEQNLSLLKSGKVKGVRFETLARICDVLECQPGDLLEAVAVKLDGAPAEAGTPSYKVHPSIGRNERHSFYSVGASGRRDTAALYIRLRPSGRTGPQ